VEVSAKAPTHHIQLTKKLPLAAMGKSARKEGKVSSNSRGV